jgi:hypothetical protein
MTAHNDRPPAAHNDRLTAGHKDRLTAGHNDRLPATPLNGSAAGTDKSMLGGGTA